MEPDLIRPEPQTLAVCEAHLVRANPGLIQVVRDEHARLPDEQPSGLVQRVPFGLDHNDRVTHPRPSTS